MTTVSSRLDNSDSVASILSSAKKDLDLIRRQTAEHDYYTAPAEPLQRDRRPWQSYGIRSIFSDNHALDLTREFECVNDSTWIDASTSSQCSSRNPALVTSVKAQMRDCKLVAATVVRLRATRPPRQRSTETNCDPVDTAIDLSDGDLSSPAKHEQVEQQENTNDWLRDLLERRDMPDKMYRAVVRVFGMLSGVRLAELAHFGRPSEPVQVRLAMNNATDKLRRLFGTHRWDSPFLRSLNELLLLELTEPFLAIYLDVLRTLAHEVPKLVIDLINLSRDDLRDLQTEVSVFVQKRPWDPSALLVDCKLKPPHKPTVFLIIPGVPTLPGSEDYCGDFNKRSLSFYNSINRAQLGKCIQIQQSVTDEDISLTDLVPCLVQSAVQAIEDARKQHKQAQLVLLGWGPGAHIAVQAASETSVDLICICIDFGNLSVNGLIGVRSDDSFMNSKHPTLFIVGELAGDCDVEAMKDMVSDLGPQSGLLTIGNCSTQLLMSPDALRQQSITQRFVDRHIIDEICQFVNIACQCPPELTATSNLTAHGTSQGQPGKQSAGSSDSPPLIITQDEPTAPGSAAASVTRSSVSKEKGRKRRAPSVSPSQSTSTRDMSSSEDEETEYKPESRVHADVANTSTTGSIGGATRTRKIRPPKFPYNIG